MEGVNLTQVGLLVVGLLIVAEKVAVVLASAKALRQRDPATEPVTREDLADALAPIKKDVAEVRDYARDNIHGLRDWAHAIDMKVALVQKSLDNGLKYRVEQLERHAQSGRPGAEPAAPAQPA